MPVVQFSGLASGIDGKAITEAMIEGKRLASIPLENKVATNEAETKALEEFNTKLLTLSSTVRDFLTLSGGAVEKTASSSNADAVSVIASSNATNASSTINVLNLARTATISFDDRFSSIDAPIAPGLTGQATISVTIGSGSGQQTANVTIDNTTTLANLTRSISDALPGKIQASYVNAGTETAPEYVLLVQGLESGIELGTMSISVSPELTGQGVFQNQNIVQAEDALIEITGIGQVRRAKNQISDLLPGISLDLKQAGTGPITISVFNDASSTAMKVADMVAAFNELVNYSRDNNKIERIDTGKTVTNQYGDLARTRVDDQAIATIRRALSDAMASIADSPVRTAADLGITTERDGTLKFDEQTFLSAVGKNPQATEQILHAFGDRIGSAAGIVADYTRFNGLIDMAIKSNTTENNSLNERLRRLEENLERQRESLNRLFANLESTVSRLNSDSTALTGLIANSFTPRSK